VKRRCIIPADGFYEWAPAAARKQPKQPWFFRRRDGEPLAFAGLWEIWHDPKDPDQEHAPRIRSCVIVTTDANELVAPVHDRMPVVLPESVWAEWLDVENQDTKRLQKLLVPADPSEMEAWPVTTMVNKADHNGPELLDRLPA